MAKYSELPDGGGTIAGTDQMAFNQGGVSRRGTVDELGAYLVGSSYTAFDPDATPTGAHASSDDMLDAVASAAKWDLWSPGSNLSVAYDEDKKTAIVSATGNGSDRWGGIYQAAPSSEFTVVSRFALACPAAMANYHAAGLFVSGDIAGSPTTAPFLIAVVANGASSAFIGVQTWTDYNGPASDAMQRSISGIDTVCMRVRVNGTLVEVDMSAGGRGWQRASSGTLAYTPSHFGLGAFSTPNGTRADGVFDYAWVFDGVSGFDDVPQAGKRILLRAE